MAKVVEAEVVDGKVEYVARTKKGGEITGILTRYTKNGVLTDEALEQMSEQMVGVEVKGLNDEVLEELKGGEIEHYSISSIKPHRD